MKNKELECNSWGFAQGQNFGFGMKFVVEGRMLLGWGQKLG